MFKMWSGQNDSPESERSPVSSGREKGGSDASLSKSQDSAIEAVAKILRTWGRHTFDLDNGDAETFEKDFERWARHVLLGTTTSDDPDAREEYPDGRRNWGGLNQFVNRHRQNEKNYVVKGFHALRDVIWTFTSTVSQAFIQEQGVDGHMQAHIGRLRNAVASRSPEDIKREVLAAAEDLSKLVEDRSQQARLRVEKLGEKLKQVEAELGQTRQQMTLDGLTQLYNRAALDQHLEQVSALSILSDSPACLMMIDIDHFKRVNDSYGHRAGDSVICEVAKRTVLTFPRKTDFVARYGGEEFAVVIQGVGLEAARVLGERLLATVRQTLFEHEDLQLSVTVSIGLAEYLMGGTPANWIERADQALYRAKQSGRNQLCAAGDPQPELVGV
ncbi:GGDEF domain-containing protein [Candidatus Nitronereus thalassa]|uniref:diguanylate cyclase n=1 Tax=Candidatus Nitronereus thalassa TaxID=3020898 RepID=A0ABU3K6Y7_9BACT|nr:GGDEF domain-containing protein [Candidatus Nitronereus thalassa]MDT7042129.1 GGDEF domain-containing protein [Candidatus Nitronereus thalassa]